MDSKEVFSILFYDGLKEAVENIPDKDTKDVYICKLFINNSESDSGVACVDLRYNTNTAFQKQTEEIINNWEKYEKEGWIWAFGEKDSAISLAKKGEFRIIHEKIEFDWGRVSIKIDFDAYYFLVDWQNQIDYEDESEKFYEFYTIHFKDLMVELCKKLIEEEVVLNKFGKNIPFLIECEEDEDSEIDVAETGILEPNKKMTTKEFEQVVKKICLRTGQDYDKGRYE